MEMIPVESSNISAIGYDSESAILRIEFNSGAVYDYYDVPEHVHDELMAADSKGQYAHQNVYKVYNQQRIR